MATKKILSDLDLKGKIDATGTVLGSNLSGTNTGDQVSSDFTHDDLTGFVANEHINWTADQGATNIHSGNYTNTNTQLSTEAVQDIIGGMVSSNTETNIAVTYDDASGKLNFVSTDTNTDTTYTAGNGLSLSGTEFRMAGGAIGGSVDLDTYQSSGYYVQGSNSNANSGTNWPTANAGILTVVRAEGNTTHITQTYDQYNSNAFYNRSYFAGTWSSWRNLAQDTNTDTNTTYVSSDFTHDDLMGFVANEHLDWTTDRGATNIHSGNYTNTNTQLSTEAVQDIVGAMLTGNIETNITVTYQDADGTIDFVSTDTNTDTNTQLSTEAVQDIIGGMVAGNTETNIAVTYDDASGKLNFVSTDTNTDTNTQRTDEEIRDVVGAIVSGSGATTVTVNDAANTIVISSTDTNTDTNTQLTTEQVQDIMGATWIDGTNTTIVYDDANGTLKINSTDTNTNTQRAIHDTPVNGATTTSISSNWAFDNVKTAVPAGALFTDTNTQNTYVSSDFTHNDLSGVSANEHLDWTTDRGATNIHSGNYTNTNTQLSTEAVQDIIGGMVAGNTETNIAVTYDDASGKLNFVSTDTNTDTNTTYVSSDFTHDDLTGFVANEHINWTADQGATNIHANNYTDTNTQLSSAQITAMGFSTTDNNTFRGIHDTPVNGATTTSISSNWAFDNVKTAVPAGALFTDTDTNTVYSHPSYSSTNINTSGATIVDIITTNSTGHVTALGTRTLTLADLGYTGATNANNITNNNQLSNGAGYLTSSSTQSKYLRSDASDRTTGNLALGTLDASSGVGGYRILKISSIGNGEVNLDHTDGGSGSDIGLFSFSRNGDHLAHIKGAHDGSITSAFLSFHTQVSGDSFANAADNERMRITSDGKIGIGTSSPDLSLDIKSGLNGGIRISATDTTSNWRDISIRSYVSETEANALPEGTHIYTGSPTGASTETPFGFYGATVIQGRDNGNGGLAIRLGNGSGHSTMMWMGSTGVTTFTNTVTASNFILSSDSRLKEKVEEVDNKSINVDWKTFEMKSDKGQKRYGVIAQELEEVHPEFVRTDEKGMKSVAYVDLLIAKNAELEARLEKLERLLLDK